MSTWLDQIRSRCAEIASSAQLVRIQTDVVPPAGGTAGLDPAVHLLEAPAEDRVRYVLILDAINFGSGWFHTLRTRGDEDPTTAMSRALSEHARTRGGPWTPAELRALDAPSIASVLGQDPGHELMGLYARALNQLGAWMGDRGGLDVVRAAGGSAERLARSLAAGMTFFDDPGFYKRAQIAANDLVLAGVAEFADVDRLTVFADNLLPHVLRIEGVLEYDPALAARIDAGEELPHGSQAEVELRACTVHACERIAEIHGVAPRVLDNHLWNRGLEERYRRHPPHRTRTVAY